MRGGSLLEGGNRFSHKMIYDDGTVIKRVGKKAGWIEDEDGDKLRNMRLGFDRSVSSIDEWKCRLYGSSFHSDKALRIHARLGKCASYSEMTTKEQEH